MRKLLMSAVLILSGHTHTHIKWSYSYSASYSYSYSVVILILSGHTHTRRSYSYSYSAGHDKMLAYNQTNIIMMISYTGRYLIIFNQRDTVFSQ